MKSKHILPDLLLTFMKIGFFTFGGGYAMIAMIEDACVEKKKWITHDEMMNITVIAESTPGPIAINCATFTGYKQAGFIGALAATLGMILPSFLVIYLISMFLDNFLEITLIANAFKGIRIAVGLLILDAACTMIRKMHKKVLCFCLCFTKNSMDAFRDLTKAPLPKWLKMAFLSLTGHSAINGKIGHGIEPRNTRDIDNF